MVSLSFISFGGGVGGVAGGSSSGSTLSSMSESLNRVTEVDVEDSESRTSVRVARMVSARGDNIGVSGNTLVCFKASGGVFPIADAEEVVAVGVSFVDKAESSKSPMLDMLKFRIVWIPL